jgi:hypothetical protein
VDANGTDDQRMARALVIAAILIVVLIVPTAAWFVVRGRNRRAALPEVERSGPRHRWWQP